MQQTLVVVQAQQQRADHLPFCRVPESADHAISRPHAFDLLHAVALAGSIRDVQTFSNHAVEFDAGG